MTIFIYLTTFYHFSKKGLVVQVMIVYTRLWQTMKEKNVSQYTLIEKHGFSRATINRLKYNKNVNVETLSKLCKILNCKLSEIAEDDQHPE